MRHVTWLACGVLIGSALLVGCSRQAAAPATAARPVAAPARSAQALPPGTIVSKDPRQVAVKRQFSGSKKVTVKVPLP